MNVTFTIMNLIILVPVNYVLAYCTACSPWLNISLHEQIATVCSLNIQKFYMKLRHKIFCKVGSFLCHIHTFHLYFLWFSSVRPIRLSLLAPESRCHRRSQPSVGNMVHCRYKYVLSSWRINQMCIDSSYLP